MRDWFDSLQERERMFVVTAAVLLVLALFYLAVWMPIAKSQKSLATSVEIWSEQLAQLRPIVGKLQTQSGPRTISNESLVVIVDRTVREHGLANALQRSQPTGSNSVRVQFESAAFDDLILWLGALNSNDGLRVQTANFSATSSEMKGRVNSTLTLER
ncbi:MAG: type II secretion system protein M [Gammaproteobacteria bacterium]|nr:type II secretion system protein M [Gammaproteobacteria bacterium]